MEMQHRHALASDTRPPAPRRRRWWLALSIGVVGLGLYAGALTWASKQLEAGVENSIHPLPVMLETQPRGEI